MAKLQMSPVFDFDSISYEKESEVHLDVVITAPDKTDLKRLPLQLILAIDCSGSMDGGKLDSVKTTVEKLINHLTENDSLGILGFSDTVWSVSPTLPMNKENKDMAKTSVKALRTISATNLSDAMVMAMERAVTSEKDKISRIVLLTDGLPTAGKTVKQDLIDIAANMNPTVSMTTFGYGMDFDSELMASISRMGRGNSFYIKNDEDCSKAFAMELGGLLSLYGQNIKILITPSGNMTFKELLSEYKCEQKQGYRLLTSSKVDITIDDIYFGERKHVVLKLTVPAATEAVCARATRVCDIEVSYLDAETKNQEVISDTAKIQYSKDPQKEPNIDVKKQLMLLEAARIQKEAQEQAEKGDLSGARNLLSKGASFVSSNMAYFDNAAPMMAMYEHLSENYVDQRTYATTGRKMSTSYTTAMSTSRASSADSAELTGMVYTSGIQEKMVQAFSNPNSGDPGIVTEAVKDIGTDPEEEKKV